VTIPIENVFRELSKIASEQRSKSFLAISRGSDSEEIVIKGNRAGLISLATTLVDLAFNGQAGSHRNFDRFSGADEAEVAVVFARTLAPWESDQYEAGGKAVS
jgi:hypothetical protein